VKGAWSAMGCPDEDQDGVEDLEDLCPAIPGSPQLNGCPDKDGDGVADRSDKCPGQVGSVLTYGCPDRDADGLANFEDECPKLPGPKGRRGCPLLDTDADGALEDETALCLQRPAFPMPYRWPEKVDAVFQMLEYHRLEASEPEQEPLPDAEPSKAEPGSFDF